MASIKYLDRILPTPAENLALEEVLLDDCEAGGDEVLRVWEPAEPFVVVGYGNAVAAEVNLAACAREGVPVLRRSSGGGTVVQMPGCLCYALILRVERAAALAGIRETNRYILGRVAGALRSLVPWPIEWAGDTDLAIGNRKFAGNSQRRKRHAVLFHGSLLLRADLSQISRLLPQPSREPAYRAGRSHEEFLLNLGLDPAKVNQAFRQAWEAFEPHPGPDLGRVAELVREKYGNARWILRA
ncbi:MAG: lipoate--protein ligase family protein [Verrucomicrobia bacterium]|nr:lipoate--protein ligase family protein [Verrucomicrobiota bacterium]